MVRAVQEAIATSEIFDMTRWYANLRCQTSFCIGGHTVILALQRPELATEWWEKAGGGDKLFMEGVRQDVSSLNGSEKPTRRVAGEILGLWGKANIDPDSVFHARYFPLPFRASYWDFTEKIRAVEAEKGWEQRHSALIKALYRDRANVVIARLDYLIQHYQATLKIILGEPVSLKNFVSAET
ncbi:MAG: hypothetical protein WBB28_01900 [Crinalium sp.]